MKSARTLTRPVCCEISDQRADERNEEIHGIKMKAAVAKR